MFLASNNVETVRESIGGIINIMYYTWYPTYQEEVREELRIWIKDNFHESEKPDISLFWTRTKETLHVLELSVFEYNIELHARFFFNY